MLPMDSYYVSSPGLDPHYEFAVVIVPPFPERDQLHLAVPSIHIWVSLMVRNQNKLHI
jgi:hypothetical protein